MPAVTVAAGSTLHAAAAGAAGAATAAATVFGSSVAYYISTDRLT